MSSYRATAARDAPGWSVRITGGRDPLALRARDLADVEPRCRKLIAQLSGQAPEDVDLEIEVRLPAAIQDRLDVVRQLCDDIAVEYDAAIDELTEMGLSRLDVARVLHLYHRLPRALTVTDAEIAEHGLARHPGAVGVEWDDHGQFVTRKCRCHVDASRREYRALPPDGENGLVYDLSGFHCDFCPEGGEDADQDDSVGEAACQ